MSRTTVVRGMKDILPAQAHRWHWVEDAARQVFSEYGYREMRTPIVEHTELFQRSIGADTDIVEKEMYTFADRKGRNLSLRPEATASCVRAAVENSLTGSGQGLRIWYAGPMFRYEKMQKERYRQFYQLGAEIYGHDDPSADAEIILLSARLWRQLGLGQLELQINSLGTREEQAGYRQNLRDYLEAHHGDLDADSRRRLKTNPLRVLDSKNPDLQGLIDAAPTPLDHLNPQSRQHFATLQEILNQCGLDFTINRRLVRGLDYYTRSVFEWVSQDLGAQSAVCGGGRYDQLFSEVGGPATGAMGFSAGIERILAVMDTRQAKVPVSVPHIYLAAVGDAPGTAAHAIAENLRNRLMHLHLQVDAGPGSFKAKLKRADRSGALYALILGENELNDQVVQLKNLRASSQDTIALDNLAGHIKTLLQASDNTCC